MELHPFGQIVDVRIDRPGRPGRIHVGPGDRDGPLVFVPMGSGSIGNSLDVAEPGSARGHAEGGEYLFPKESVPGFPRDPGHHLAGGDEHDIVISPACPEFDSGRQESGLGDDLVSAARCPEEEKSEIGDPHPMGKEVSKAGLPCHPRIVKPEFREVFDNLVVPFEKAFLDERGGESGIKRFGGGPEPEDGLFIDGVPALDAFDSVTLQEDGPPVLDNADGQARNMKIGKGFVDFLIQNSERNILAGEQRGQDGKEKSGD